jgi:hypothetical protein
MDCQRVRYLVFQFRSLADDATIAGLHISGVPWVEPELDLSQSSAPAAALSPMGAKARQVVDSQVSLEYQRLVDNGGLAAYYAELLGKGKSLDAIDFDSLYDVRQPDVMPRRSACESCGKKELCQPCWGCLAMACSRCIVVEDNPDCYVCQSCAGCRNQLRLAITVLRAQRATSRAAFYPMEPAPAFLARARDFARVDAVPIASLLCALPNGEGGVGAESLLCGDESGVWAPDTNLVQFQVAFVCECELSAIEVACEAPLEIAVKGAEPLKFKVHPPGFVLPLSFTGRVAIMTFSGDVIRLRRIRFVGKMVLPVASGKKENSGAAAPAVEDCPERARRFVQKENAHEFEFERTVAFAGLKFPDASLVGKNIVFDVRNGGKGKIFHFVIAQTTSSKRVSVCLASPIQANSVKVWYSRVSPQAAQSLASDPPIALIHNPQRQLPNLSQ